MQMLPFGLRLVGASFVTQIQNNIFSVILGRHYTKVDVGYYSQGSKWASMGSQVFGGMVNSVGQPVLTHAAGDVDRQRAIFRKLCRFLAFAAFPAMMGLAFIAPEFIDLINPEFGPSVPILRLYCLYFIAFLLQTLFTQVAMACGRSDRYLLFTLINAALQISVALLTYRYGLVTMAAAVTVTNFVAVLVWYFLARDIIDIKIWHFLWDTLPYFVVVLLIIVVTHYAVQPITSSVWRMLAKIAMVAVLYIAVMRLTASKTFGDVVTYIKKREL